MDSVISEMQKANKIKIDVWNSMWTVLEIRAKQQLSNSDNNKSVKWNMSAGASDNELNIDSVQKQESSKVEEVEEAEEMNFSKEQQLSGDARDLIEIKFNPKKVTWG